MSIQSIIYTFFLANIVWKLFCIVLQNYLSLLTCRKSLVLLWQWKSYEINSINKIFLCSIYFEEEHCSSLDTKILMGLDD